MLSQNLDRRRTRQEHIAMVKTNELKTDDSRVLKLVVVKLKPSLMVKISVSLARKIKLNLFNQRKFRDISPHLQTGPSGCKLENVNIFGQKINLLRIKLPLSIYI